MKSAEELFEKYRMEQPLGFGYIVYWLDKDKFIQALAEHDAEIKKLIDEIKQKYCIDKWFDKDEVADILNELKEKLK